MLFLNVKKVAKYRLGNAKKIKDKNDNNQLLSDPTDAMYFESL